VEQRFYELVRSKDGPFVTVELDDLFEGNYSFSTSPTR